MIDEPSPLPSPRTTPQFPESILVGSLGELARIMSEGSEVPAEFYWAAAITILGSVCSSRLHLRVRAAAEPRLYTVLVGESYAVKKSTALRNVLLFFLALEEEGFPSMRVVHGVGSAEGLAKELKKPGGLLLAYDELRAFVEKTKIRSAVLLPMVTSLFEGHDWDNAISEGNIKVRDARLSLVGCCTQDTFSTMWSSEAIAIGFPNRLLIVAADQTGKVALPEVIDDSRMDSVRAWLLAQMTRLPCEYSFNLDAAQVWTDWYESLPISVHVKRLDTIGLRLLSLVALTTDKRSIDLATVGAVLGVMDYELAVRRLFDPIDADNAVAWLEQAVRYRISSTDEGMSKRDLRRAIHADRKGLWAFEQAIIHLMEAKDIVLMDGRYYLPSQLRVKIQED